jgi:hypothetical protein
MSGLPPPGIRHFATTLRVRKLIDVEKQLSLNPPIGVRGRSTGVLVFVSRTRSRLTALPSGLGGATLILSTTSSPINPDLQGR